MLEPFGECALDGMTLEQIWKGTPKATSALLTTVIWQLARISVTAAALLASVRNYRTQDMESYRAEAVPEGPGGSRRFGTHLAGFNFGRGSANQEYSEGFRDAKRAMTTAGGNVIDPAANPMDPLKAASQFRAWLLKEKSAFRIFLFILPGNNTYCTGHKAELVARPTVKCKPMSEQDFCQAARDQQGMRRHWLVRCLRLPRSTACVRRVGPTFSSTSTVWAWVIWVASVEHTVNLSSLPKTSSDLDILASQPGTDDTSEKTG